ncbi:MAG: type VI secretion system-associated protein TagF, partial [Rhodothermales bacterium]
AYFGKIPTHGDFVRHNAGSATMRALDEWIQQGLYFAKTHMSQALNTAYEEAHTCSFFFAPREAAQVFLGVIRPSRDSVGRTFPFLVGQEMETSAFDTHHVSQVSIAYHAFFERAAHLVDKGVEGRVGHHDLTPHVEALGTPVADASSVAFFGHYLQQTRLTSLWERLWGHAQDSRKYLLFKNLLDILLPLRSGVPAHFPLVLRFPLCSDGRTLDFDVSFWIGLCLRLLGYPALQPSFFWSQAGPARDKDVFLLVALRPPSPKTFAYLLPGHPESDTLCNLEQMGGQKAALAALSIPARYGRMLEDEQLTLWDFLRHLH